MINHAQQFFTIPVPAYLRASIPDHQNSIRVSRQFIVSHLKAYSPKLNKGSQHFAHECEEMERISGITLN